MNDTATLASEPHQAALPGSSGRPAGLSHLTALRNMFATYRARRRFRWDLEQLARDNPHLIDDIGLARWQIEAEIAKRFWQI